MEIEKPLRAYSVIEEFEHTGGIIFARHNVTARRIGANEYADGDFRAVTCKRTPWADKYAETGIIPASEMVHAGWYFECCGCGVTIEEVLSYRWEDEGDLTYRGWAPGDVIGTQHSQIFHSQECKYRYDTETAARNRACEKAIGRFQRVILRRFPNAQFIDNEGYRCKPYAWANRNKSGHWRIEQCCVPFTLPDFDAQHGPISLDYYPSSDGDRKPRYTCAGGDKEAFEAYCRACSL
jgi:hypothetical protein|tara:strand:+ start:319 stop:1029 length:711 start_codon:yes stop_codon:yes gene_type:complete